MLLSMSAVGSLQANLPPGDFVVVDQFIDRSFAREKSFFGEGCVAHVSMAHPVCPSLGDVLAASASGAGHSQCIAAARIWSWKGPQFSTKAESELYRSWGCAVIGMTNMPEAKLAREAELHYATVAMVTDYDCWHADHDHVTVDAVVKVMTENAARARALVRHAVPRIAALGECPISGAITLWMRRSLRRRRARDPALMAKLDAVAGRVMAAGWPLALGG